MIENQKKYDDIWDKFARKSERKVDRKYTKSVFCRGENWRAKEELKHALEFIKNKKEMSPVMAWAETLRSEKIPIRQSNMKKIQSRPHSRE